MNRLGRIVIPVFVFAFASLAQAQWVQSGSNLTCTGCSVGIGTAAPQSILHISGPSGVSTVTMNTPGNQLFRFGTIGGITNWGAETINARYSSGWNLDDTTTNGWFFKLDTRAGNVASFNNGMWLYRVPNGPNPHTDEAAVFGITNGRAFFRDAVGIGNADPTVTPDATLTITGTAHVTGAVTVDGNLAAKYQDVAEWVPTSEPLTDGTVVIVDPSANNTVSSSHSAYETSVAGVVSAQPGIILGVPSDSKAKIATTGRVKVRVDATNGAIKPGDLLVTSDQPGFAMKSQPVNIGGVKVHRPGTIIGKALEPLASGKGEILVLLTLQ